MTCNTTAGGTPAFLGGIGCKCLCDRHSGWIAVYSDNSDGGRLQKVACVATCPKGRIDNHIAVSCPQCREHFVCHDGPMEKPLGCGVKRQGGGRCLGTTRGSMTVVATCPASINLLRSLCSSLSVASVTSASLDMHKPLIHDGYTCSLSSASAASTSPHQKARRHTRQMPVQTQAVRRHVVCIAMIEATGTQSLRRLTTNHRRYLEPPPRDRPHRRSHKGASAPLAASCTQCLVCQDIHRVGVGVSSAVTHLHLPLEFGGACLQPIPAFTGVVYLSQELTHRVALDSTPIDWNDIRAHIQLIPRYALPDANQYWASSNLCMLASGSVSHSA